MGLACHLYPGQRWKKQNFCPQFGDRVPERFRSESLGRQLGPGSLGQTVVSQKGEEHRGCEPQSACRPSLAIKKLHKTLSLKHQWEKIRIFGNLEIPLCIWYCTGLIQRLCN